MEKKIIYVLRGKLNIYPPCVSQIYMMLELGKSLMVICNECNESLRKDLENRGVEVILVKDKRINHGKLGKVSSYINFRKGVKEILRSLDKSTSIVWFGSADSAISLIGIINGWKYIVNSLELYDKNRFYRIGLSLLVKKMSGLVVCEYNRAKIMQSWWGLEKLPYIMPNKPYNHPIHRNIEPHQDMLKNIIQELQGSKPIIYQGLIMWSSKHIETIASALSEMGGNYTLVLLGNNDNRLHDKIKKIYNHTLSIEYITAPDHLVITSYAYIGITTYDETSLNNLYCAPNKIYEYAGFGIPMLCSDIPGLRYTVAHSKAGECTDLSSVEKVKEAIKKINQNYEQYSINAKDFFNNTDNKAVLKNIISNI
ncbi:glycosyltransferase [Solibacillus silvestris]